MNELIKEFEGKPVHFRLNEDGRLGLTADELGQLLGYGDRGHQVRKNIRRHWDELAPFVDSGQFAPSLGPRQVIYVFDHGIWILASLAKTEIGKRFRLWVANIIEGGRRGELAIVPAKTDSLAQFAATASQWMSTLSGQVVEVKGELSNQQTRLRAIEDKTAAMDPEELTRKAAILLEEKRIKLGSLKSHLRQLIKHIIVRSQELVAAGKIPQGKGWNYPAVYEAVHLAGGVTKMDDYATEEQLQRAISQARRIILELGAEPPQPLLVDMA